MASRALIDTAVQLYKSLGGNVSKILGTRTNVNFLGKGKSSELMVDMDINPEALGVLPKSKAIDIDTEEDWELAEAIYAYQISKSQNKSQ